MNAAASIRAEQPEDYAAVHVLNCEAFESPAEARLVDALRCAAAPLVSLVAEQNAQVVGHILFSPVTLPDQPALKLMGLAPMAVSAALQRSGIGSALIRAGLQHCTTLGYGAVVVLGHPDYYPRFGFQPSLRFGITCEYEAPPEAFMLLELQPDYLRGVSGTVRYYAAFTGV